MIGDELTEAFEAERGKLEAVAYRLLGSRSEAEDAVQEAWIRLDRVDSVENLSAWLRTVVTRICLDVLRARKVRPEDPTGPELLEQAPATGSTPEDEALVADSVSRALLVVLDTLAPAERIAFVLHDMFAVPFGRSRRSSIEPGRDQEARQPGSPAGPGHPRRTGGRARPAAARRVSLPRGSPGR